MLPEFKVGDEVRIIRNIRNDGTFPGAETGDLLLKAGAVGVVRDVGTFLQDQIIYTVHVVEQDKVIGCREQEVISADEPWKPSKFDTRTNILAAQDLGAEGEVIVPKGTEGYILKVVRDRPGPVCYRVHFPDYEVLVPEGALMAGPNTRVIEEFVVE